MCKMKHKLVIPLLSFLVIILAQYGSAVRLLETSYPINYQLKFLIDVDNYEFSGTDIITLNVTEENVFKIQLHIKDLQVESVALREQTINQDIVLNPITFQELNELMEINTKEALNLGVHNLEIKFSGKIRDDLKGLYMSSYWVDENVKKNIATTFFASIYARMAFPCYDEPAYKATFDIEIYHNSSYHALSNMPLVCDPVPYPDRVGFSTSTFQTTPKMSTYLVAFIVSDLSKNGNESLAVWSQTAQLAKTEYSLQQAAKSKIALQNYLEDSYQLPKLDLVAIDDFLMGAMENWGLITFLSSRLLPDSRSTTMSIQKTVKIITHELAHQWFGNLVTCRWWDAVWLNEGFASYYEDLITDITQPDWRIMEQFVVLTKQNVMRLDSTVFNNKAMNEKVLTLEEMRNIYDFVNYDKAASVIRMIHHGIGDDAFRKGIKNYLESNAYDSAESSELYSHLARAMLDHPLPIQTPSIVDAFSSWESNPGFPMIEMSREGTGILLSQKRFFASHFTNGPDFKYYIPVNWITDRTWNEASTNPKLWMRPNNEQTPLGIGTFDWVLFDPQSTGYYRVKYDELGWRKLIGVLEKEKDKIPPASRAQLVDDVFAMARYQNTSFETALDLSKYLKTELDPIVLMSAIVTLQEFERNIRDYDYVSDYLWDLIEPWYTNRQVSIVKDIDKISLLEVSKISCRFRLEKCMTDALIWINQDELLASLPVDSQPAIFCGLLGADEGIEIVINHWKSLSSTEFNRIQNDRDISVIIDAFSCLQNSTYQTYILHSTIIDRPNLYLTGSDRQKLFSNVASSGLEGTEAAIKFMLINFNTMEKLYDPFPKVYEALGLNTVTFDLVILFNQLYNRHIAYRRNVISNSLYDASMAAAQQVSENSQFRINHREAISNWLTANYKDSSSHLSVSLSLIIITLLMAFLK